MRSNLEKNSSYGIAVSDPASALKPSEKPGEHGRHVHCTCVCVCVFLLYSVQLGGQRSPLSTTALMVYLAHS